MKYKNQVRSRVFNLRDKKNPMLRGNFLNNLHNHDILVNLGCVCSEQRRKFKLIGGDLTMAGLQWNTQAPCLILNALGLIVSAPSIILNAFGLEPAWGLCCGGPGLPPMTKDVLLQGPITEADDEDAA